MARSFRAPGVFVAALFWAGLVGATSPVASYASPAETEKPPAGFREMVESIESFPDTGNAGADLQLKGSIRLGTLGVQRGYSPAQVTVQNLTGQPRPVRVAFHSEGAVTERTVEVAPRGRASTWLLVPADQSSGYVELSAPGLESTTKGLYLDNNRGPRVLVLGDLKGFEDRTGMPRAADNEEPLVTLRFLEPDTAPRELAAYTGYETVLVAVESEKVPDDVWAVLESYALSGGRLVLGRPPADPRPRLPLLTDAQAELSPYGFGQVRQFRACLQTPGACGVKLGEDARGAQAMVTPAGPPPRWERNDMLRDNLQPLLESARAPIGRFMLLIVLFTLAVGPGALVLARRKGPLAVLIAVPSMAAFTCIALVAWSVLVDGFSVHSARYSVTLLDRERSRAVTVGVAAWYANLTEDSLRMPASSVLVAPQDPEDPPRQWDWTNGLALKSSFLPSRAYREWGEVAVLPSRARLTARREGDTLQVQNALGAPLRNGTLKLDGELWVLPALEDGAQGVAVRKPKGTAEDSLDFNPELRRRLVGAMRPVDLALEEREFLARLGGKGPTPTSALELELEDAVHLVRGRSEEARP